MDKQPKRITATDPSIERIGKGILLHFVKEKQIAVYTFNSPSAEDIDLWAARALEVDYNFPEQRSGSLYDLTQNENGLSPYIRKRLVGVFCAMPDNTPIELAFVIPQTRFAVQTIQKYIQREVCTQRPNLHIQFFHEIGQGLNWLQRDIDSLVDINTKDSAES